MFMIFKTINYDDLCMENLTDYLVSELGFWSMVLSPKRGEGCHKRNKLNYEASIFCNYSLMIVCESDIVEP